MILIIVFGFIFLCLFVVAIILYVRTVRLGSALKQRAKRRAQTRQNDRPAKLRREAEDWLEAQRFVKRRLIAFDGAKLTAWYLPPEGSEVAILIHGYATGPEWMAPIAKVYAGMGYGVLAPYNRGHGKSSAHIGMGVLDRFDYLGWIDHVRTLCGQDVRIVVHGVSMGGATVAFLSGESLPSAVHALIADSAYASVKRELASRLKRDYHLPAFPVLPLSSLICRVFSGFFYGGVDGTKAVTGNRTPILFIHSKSDDLVPYANSCELYEAAGGEKDLWLVEGCSHARVMVERYEEYWERVGGFLRNYM